MYNNAEDKDIMYMIITGKILQYRNVAIHTSLHRTIVTRMNFFQNFFFLIEENRCKRLPEDEAITIPLTSEGSELPQIIIDLQFSKAILWRSAIILYDDSISKLNFNLSELIMCTY